MASHAPPSRKPAEREGADRVPARTSDAQRPRCLGAAAQLAAVHRTLRGAQIQRHESGRPDRIARDAAAPPARVPGTPNRTGLPDRLKAGVEALSGLAMDDVRVRRNSAEPAKLGALAFAQGTNIHLGPGQEQHLPHEAWHVVQQKQGRVRATADFAGRQINDDLGLEAEADRMAARAAGAGAATQRLRSAAAEPVLQRAPVIQRVIDLDGAVPIKPGPPPTVSQDGWFYKVFAQNRKDRAEAIAAEWQTADDAFVPVPSYGVKAVSVGQTPKWAFRSKAAPGTFFQFSKGGHTARVVAWVMSQTAKWEVERLKKVFDYVTAHLGDGQGFYVEGSEKIVFIDINTGGTTPDAADAATACTTRLAQL